MRDGGANDYSIEESLPDITETEEIQSRFPLPSSSENLESLDQEDKEKIDIAKEMSELGEEKKVLMEQTAEETKKPRIPEKRGKVRKSSTTTMLNPVSKFQGELKTERDRTKTLEDKVNGMQKQLAKIDKTIYSMIKEQVVVRTIKVQFNILQKRLDKADRSISNLNLKSRPKAKVNIKKSTARKKGKKNSTVRRR